MVKFRGLTKIMKCMHCDTEQPCSQTCINIECQKTIAKYYCEDCKLWDDDSRKNIYHCHDCGICRIGRGLGDDYFHCKKCNVCMAISLRQNHKCIERNLESDCPICGEYMFTSTTTVIFMVIFRVNISLADIAFITNVIRNTFELIINAQHAPNHLQIWPTTLVASMLCSSNTLCHPNTKTRNPTFTAMTVN